MSVVFFCCFLIKTHLCACALVFSDVVTPAIDVYAFGMCALEMASLEIQGNGDSGTLVTQEHINRTIESLDDPLQKDLIRQCLTADFEQRPSARNLLFHPVLFEVHSLKLLAAHVLVKTGKCVRRCYRWLRAFFP